MAPNSFPKKWKSDYYASDERFIAAIQVVDALHMHWIPGNLDEKAHIWARIASCSWVQYWMNRPWQLQEAAVNLDDFLIEPFQMPFTAEEHAHLAGCPACLQTACDAIAESRSLLLSDRCGSGETSMDRRSRNRWVRGQVPATLHLTHLLRCERCRELILASARKQVAIGICKEKTARDRLSLIRLTL